MFIHCSLQPARVFYTLKLTSRTRLEHHLIAVQCCEIPNMKLHFGASIIAVILYLHGQMNELSESNVCVWKIQLSIINYFQNNYKDTIFYSLFEILNID